MITASYLKSTQMYSYISEYIEHEYEYEKMTHNFTSTEYIGPDTPVAPGLNHNTSIVSEIWPFKMLWILSFFCQFWEIMKISCSTSNTSNSTKYMCKNSEIWQTYSPSYYVDSNIDTIVLLPYISSPTRCH